jgi:predicted RNA-binding Zn-ribbon protein involved in translation (DUF1610 family)
MAFTYCSSCGTKIEYTSTKPNFCTNCGEALNPNSSKPEKVEVQQEESKGFQGIAALEYEVSHGRSNEVTIGTTLGTPAAGNFSRREYKSRTGNVVNDIIQDCGSSKSKDIEDIEGK